VCGNESAYSTHTKRVVAKAVPAFISRYLLLLINQLNKLNRGFVGNGTDKILGIVGNVTGLSAIFGYTGGDMGHFGVIDHTKVTANYTVRLLKVEYGKAELQSRIQRA
jgi:hypothetical protein